MMKIALTGGIGSGKSLVASYFSELEIPVYNADDEAKKLMISSKDIMAKMIEEFGKKAYKKGKLNRKYLAGIVFSNKEKLKTINGIVHPEVAKHFKKWAIEQEAPYILQENALIFENNSAVNFDAVITVTAPLNLRIERIIKRDKAKKEQVLLRMNNQWEDARKIEGSDFVIENIDMEDTRRQVAKIHKLILKKTNH